MYFYDLELLWGQSSRGTLASWSLFKDCKHRKESWTRSKYIMQHACKILNMFEILISVVWGKKLVWVAALSSRQQAKGKIHAWCGSMRKVRCPKLLRKNKHYLDVQGHFGWSVHRVPYIYLSDWYMTSLRNLLQEYMGVSLQQLGSPSMH